MARDVIERVFMPEFEKWAPYGSYEPPYKGDKHFTNEIRYHGGGRHYIFSTDQKVKQFEGGNYDLVDADEPFQIVWYSIGLKRSRGKGPFIWFATPKWDSHAAMFLNEIEQLPPEEVVLHTNVHLYSACKERGIRGFRTKEEIDSEEKTTRQGEEDATVKGMKMAFAGKVLTEFDPLVNVIDESTAIDWIRNEGCSWYMGIDPHPNYPHLLGLAAVLPKGEIIFVDEWPRWVPGSVFDMVENTDNFFEYWFASRSTMFHKMVNFGCKNPRQFARIVERLEEDVILKYTGGFDRSGLPLFVKVGTDFERRYVDPSMAASKSSSSNFTLQEEWYKHGIVVTPSRSGKDLKAGHEMLNNLLGGSVVDSKLKVPPKLFFVGERCHTLIYHHFNFCYKVDESKATLEGGITEAYVETFKHGVDVDRYVAQMNPQYFESDVLVNRRQPREETSFERPQKKGLFSYM